MSRLHLQDEIKKEGTCRACPACLAPLSELAVSLSATTGIPIACLRCGAAMVGLVVRGEAFPYALPDDVLAEEHPDACLEVAVLRSVIRYQRMQADN